MQSSDISIAFETYSRVAFPEGLVHLGCLQQTSMVSWSSQSLVLIIFLFFCSFHREIVYCSFHYVFVEFCVCCQVICWHLRGFFSPISLSSLWTKCVNPSTIMYFVKYFFQLI